MNDEVKDAGLVAMISSILGGNKRADSLAPAMPPEVPAPASGPRAETPAEAVHDGAAASGLAEPEAPVAAKPVEPPAQAPVRMSADGKRLLPAEAIADLVLGELRRLEHFPASGVSVTVYGYRHWNAMIAFAPFSTTSQHAARFRQALPDIVFSLRRQVELEI
jgi:hypothetical protein